MKISIKTLDKVCLRLVEFFHYATTSSMPYYGPEPLAPFDVVLIPINMHRSGALRDAAEALYAELRDMGLEVLFDNRDARPGVKFADAELIGIPHRLVISERGYESGELEYRHRRDDASQMLKRDDALNLLRESSLT